MWDKIIAKIKKWLVKKLKPKPEPEPEAPKPPADAIETVIWDIAGDPHRILKHATDFILKPFDRLLALPITFEITKYNADGMWVKGLTVDTIPGKVNRNLIACVFDSGGELIQTEDQQDSHNSHIGKSYQRAAYYMAFDVDDLKLQGRTKIHAKV